MNHNAEAIAAPLVHDMTEGEDLDYRAIAVFLWSLLDDIDTTGDIVREDDAAYRATAEHIHKKRFEVSTSDGYAIAFTNDPK